MTSLKRSASFSSRFAATFDAVFVLPLYRIACSSDSDPETETSGDPASIADGSGNENDPASTWIVVQSSIGLPGS